MKLNKALGAVLVAGLFVGACGDDTDNEARETATTLQEQAEETASDIREGAQNAWASLRTDGERLVDEVQTRNDPEAKEELLEKCRDSLEKLRKAESAEAERVDRLCTRIRDTDVNNRDAWSDVKDEIRDINPFR